MGLPTVFGLMYKRSIWDSNVQRDAKPVLWTRSIRRPRNGFRGGVTVTRSFNAP